MRLTVLLACVCCSFVSTACPAGDMPSVEVIRDLSYVEDNQADPIKHKLDLYLPSGRKAYPLLVFVHGGGWTHGDKNYWFDLYGKVGKAFAQQGIGVAVINYRLAPNIKHPDQSKDVAKAIAWSHKNIEKFGGNARELYLAGHSAGGHLVSLVSTDAHYLKEAGLEPGVIKGVIPISAVYDVQPDILLFDMVFGKNAQIRTQASPIMHVKPGLPPFLMLHGDHELPQCDGPCAQQFQHKLEESHVTCKLLPIANRDHMSIIAKLSEPNDPGQLAIVNFIRTSKP